LLVVPIRVLVAHARQRALPILRLQTQWPKTLADPQYETVRKFRLRPNQAISDTRPAPIPVGVLIRFSVIADQHQTGTSEGNHWLSTLLNRNRHDPGIVDESGRFGHRNVLAGDHRCLRDPWVIFG
jgi:hypothetical protein